MTRYLLDTDTCIDLIRRRSPRLLSFLTRRPVGTVAISAITWAELRNGAAKSTDPARNLAALVAFCAPFAVLPFDDAAAAEYARGGADRVSSDALISAQARSRGLRLVTAGELRVS